MSSFALFGKRDIIKIFSLNALSALVKMATGFLMIKVVASIVGTSGVAMLGQLNNFCTIVLTVSTAGINNGITKFVAEFADDRASYAPFLKTGARVVLITTLVCSVILLLTSTFLAKLLFNDSSIAIVLKIFAITLVVYSSNSLLVSVLNGFKEYRKLVRINIIQSITGLVLSILLSIYFGLKGALISVVCFQTVVLAYAVVTIRKAVWFNDLIHPIYIHPAARRLANYSLMAIISAVVVPASNMIIRTYLISTQDLAQAGIWEGMNRISQMYLMVITSSLAVYYLPRLSEINDVNILREEIFTAFRLILPPLLFALIVVYLFRQPIIEIIYNPDFASMKYLFGYQLMGDFLKIASWLIAFQLLAKNMTLVYIITELLSGLIHVLISLYLIKNYGTIGAVAGYFTSYLAYLLMMMYVFRNTLFTSSQ